MPEASPSSKLVEFKGGKLSVMNAFLRETDAMKLADALHVMLGGMPDFFSGETTVLDFRHLAVAPDRIDWTSLLSMLRRYQLQPVAVRNLPEHYAASARQAGLALLSGEESEGGVPEAPPRPARPPSRRSSRNRSPRRRQPPRTPWSLNVRCAPGSKSTPAIPTLCCWPE